MLKKKARTATISLAYFSDFHWSELSMKIWRFFTSKICEVSVFLFVGCTLHQCAGALSRHVQALCVLTPTRQIDRNTQIDRQIDRQIDTRQIDTTCGQQDIFCEMIERLFSLIQKDQIILIDNIFSILPLIYYGELYTTDRKRFIKKFINI